MVEEVKDIYKVFREGDYKSESKKALRSFFSPVENIKYIIKDIKKRVS